MLGSRGHDPVTVVRLRKPDPARPAASVTRRTEITEWIGQHPSFATSFPKDGVISTAPHPSLNRRKKLGDQQ